jgi:hypothetical protein
VFGEPNFSIRRSKTCEGAEVDGVKRFKQTAEARKAIQERFFIIFFGQNSNKKMSDPLGVHVEGAKLF